MTDEMKIKTFESQVTDLLMTACMRHFSSSEITKVLYGDRLGTYLAVISENYV